jgi:hypothetical protein
VILALALALPQLPAMTRALRVLTVRSGCDYLVARLVGPPSHSVTIEAMFGLRDMRTPHTTTTSSQAAEGSSEEAGAGRAATTVARFVAWGLQFGWVAVALLVLLRRMCFLPADVELLSPSSSENSPEGKSGDGASEGRVIFSVVGSLMSLIQGKGGVGGGGEIGGSGSAGGGEGNTVGGGGGGGKGRGGGDWWLFAAWGWGPLLLVLSRQVLWLVDCAEHLLYLLCLAAIHSFCFLKFQAAADPFLQVLEHDPFFGGVGLLLLLL